MLQFQNVSFRYPQDEQPMMQNLCFDIEYGSFVSIIGASGCGKSTIFRLINGLEQLQEGQILVNGTPIHQRKQYSAFMPQKDLLFPWATIEKNVCLPLSLARVPKDIQKQRATEVLSQVGLLEYRNKYPKDLSGGMKQRVAFARTLLSGADLLLLDEPFSALDYLTRVDMQQWLLEQWQNDRKTILFITHDVEEALFLSDTIYIIQHRPFSTMEKIKVPLTYPRNREELKRADVVELKETLIEKLRKTVIV